jgi:hypothetical protein
MEKIMSKSVTEVRELTEEELSGSALDTVTGGSSVCDAIDGIAKATASAAASGGTWYV